MAMTFIERMISEHSELVERIKKLHNYIYSDASDKDDKIEFANKCLQLAAMKKYEEALRARLENQDIVYEDGEYFAHLSKPHTHHCDGECDDCPDCDSDINKLNDKAKA